MIKAGILDKESIPPRGGDNPNLPNVANFAYTWKKLRNTATSQASSLSKDSKDRSEKANGTAHGGLEPAKVLS